MGYGMFSAKYHYAQFYSKQLKNWFFLIKLVFNFSLEISVKNFFLEDFL